MNGKSEIVAEYFMYQESGVPDAGSVSVAAATRLKAVLPAQLFSYELMS